MEIKDYVMLFRDLQKSHKKVRVADFCRENMLDYYEMVEALKQEKLETESYEEQVQCGDLVITEIPDSNEATQSKPSTEGYIKEVMLSFPKGLRFGRGSTLERTSAGGNNYEAKKYGNKRHSRSW